MTDTAWLNEDFKSSKSALTLSLKNVGPGEDLPTGTVLQIQSVVNVSLPLKSLVESKVEYDGKRHMLKLCLTDGKETIYGLLYEPHPKLTNNTVPGTKIKTLRPIPIVSRILRFTRGNIEVLGGYVEPMVENWKVQREHEKRSSWGKSITSSGEDGAPKWKALDARGPSGSGVGNIRELRNAKAMDILEAAKNKGQEGKEESKTEFDAQRKEAILDLVKQQPTKKTFAVAKNIPLTISEPSVPKKEPREGPREPKSRDKKFRDRDPDDERLSREDKELASKYQYHGGQLSLKDHFSSFFGKPQAETEADPDSDIEKAIQLSLKDMNQLNIGSNDHYSSDRQSYQDRGRGGRGDRDDRGRGNRGERDDRGGRSDRGGGRGDRRGGRGDRRGGRGDRGGRGHDRGNSSYNDSRESPFQSDFRESSSSGGGPRGQNQNPSREQYSSGQADYGNGRDSYSAGHGRGGSYEDSRGYGRGGRGRDRDSFSGREDYSSRNREDYGQSNYSRDQFGGPTPYRGGKVAYSANTGYHNENGRLDSSQNQSAPRQRIQEYYAEEWPSVGEPTDSANFQAAPTQSAGSYDFKLGQNLVFNRSDRRKPDDVRDNRRYDGIWEGDIRGRGRSRGPSSRGRSSFEQPRSNYGGY